MGGELQPGAGDGTIDYVTISTLGNAIDFGDLTAANGQFSASCGGTRGLFNGGYAASPLSIHNVIDYVEILTTGNAIDFGDLSVARNNAGSVTNAHGGL